MTMARFGSGRSRSVEAHHRSFEKRGQTARHLTPLSKVFAMAGIPPLAFAFAFGAMLIVPFPGTESAIAGDTGSSILDSPSRDVIRRNEPALRSIEPGGNRTRARSLSGIVGGLDSAGGLGPSPSSSLSDCVLHHERLDRTGRQLFPSRCDPTRDVDTGYPAFTTQ